MRSTKFGLLSSCLRLRLAAAIGPSSPRRVCDRTGIFRRRRPSSFPKSKELASYLASSRLLFNLLTYYRYGVRDVDRCWARPRRRSRPRRRCWCRRMRRWCDCWRCSRRCTWRWRGTHLRAVEDFHRCHWDASDIVAAYQPDVGGAVGISGEVAPRIDKWNPY